MAKKYIPNLGSVEITETEDGFFHPHYFNDEEMPNRIILKHPGVNINELLCIYVGVNAGQYNEKINRMCDKVSQDKLPEARANLITGLNKLLLNKVLLNKD